MYTWVTRRVTSTHLSTAQQSCMVPDTIIVHGTAIFITHAPAPGVTGLDIIPGSDGALASITIQDGSMPA